MNKINLIAMLWLLLSAGIVLAEEAEEPVSPQAALAKATQNTSTESQKLAANMEAALAPYRDALINANNYYQNIKLHRQIHGDETYNQQHENDAYTYAERCYSALQQAVSAVSEKVMKDAEAAANENNPKMDLDAAKAQLEATQTAQALAAMNRLCNKVGYAVDGVNVNNSKEVADATKTCKTKLSEQQEQAKLAKESALDARKKEMARQQVVLEQQQAAAVLKKTEIATIAATKSQERADFLARNPKRKNPAFYN